MYTIIIDNGVVLELQIRPCTVNGVAISSIMMGDHVSWLSLSIIYVILMQKALHRLLIISGWAGHWKSCCQTPTRQTISGLWYSLTLQIFTLSFQTHPCL